MKIYKYNLKVTDYQIINLPKGAKILDIQTQYNEPKLWALVDEKAELEKREFAIYGTGNPLPDDIGEYLATFQIHEGQLVFHVFEVTC